MTWIKICGITNLEDALVAVEAGADALGFVFYEKSPRNVKPDTVRDIIRQLPERIEKVGVNEFSEESMASTFDVGLTALQHHIRLSRTPSPQNGQTTGFRAVACSRPLKIFLSFPASCFLQNDKQILGMAREFARVHDRDPASEPSQRSFETIFLDSGSETELGGTGKTFDWNRAIRIAEGMREGGLKLVVAGGLNRENVAEAIGILRPWGVDVSSGVESRPGKKDPEKVRAFIRAVREADKANSN